MPQHDPAVAIDDQISRNGTTRRPLPPIQVPSHGGDTATANRQKTRAPFGIPSQRDCRRSGRDHIDQTGSMGSVHTGRDATINSITTRQIKPSVVESPRGARDPVVIPAREPRQSLISHSGSTRGRDLR